MNGTSGFFPPSHAALIHGVKDFPSDAALDYLRSRGVGYVAVHGAFYGADRYRAIVQALDRRTDVAVASVGPWEGSESRLYRLRNPSRQSDVNIVNPCVAPGPPSHLVASVAGSTVTLTWAAGTGASSYRLQAGSEPGRVDLADRDLVSSATSFVATNVSGRTYFVRVRSNNTCGQSPPSNEVAVIIIQ